MQTRFRVSDGLFFFFVLDRELGDLFADDVNHAAVHHALGLASQGGAPARLELRERIDDLRDYAALGVFLGLTDGVFKRLGI